MCMKVAAWQGASASLHACKLVEGQHGRRESVQRATVYSMAAEIGTQHHCSMTTACVSPSVLAMVTRQSKKPLYCGPPLLAACLQFIQCQGEQAAPG